MAIRERAYLREQMYSPGSNIISSFSTRSRSFSLNVGHQASFSLNIYQNPNVDDGFPCFDSIWNLYDPKTIDECYASDGSGTFPGAKNKLGEWSLAGHEPCYFYLPKSELSMFSKLVGNGQERVEANSDGWNSCH